MSIENLLENRKLLNKQLFWLQHSFDAAKNISLKTEYSIDEFDTYENLCSRFARMTDFLIRKMFRSIDNAEFENQGTLIDTVNHAHKRGLFENIEELRQIKDLRNAIAHEYLDDDLQKLFADVMALTPKIIKIAEHTSEYARRYE